MCDHFITTQTQKRKKDRTRISQKVVYKANAYLARILILNVTLSIVYKGSWTTIMSYKSKVTFGTPCAL
jgi:hypothetical protein